MIVKAVKVTAFVVWPIVAWYAVLRWIGEGVHEMVEKSWSQPNIDDLAQNRASSFN